MEKLKFVSTGALSRSSGDARNCSMNGLPERLLELNTDLNQFWQTLLVADIDSKP